MDRTFQKIITIIKKGGIVAVLALGLIVRIVSIDRSPPALNWDEVAHGYNAYCLMETASDEFGNRLPILLRSFDDYKPALYAYLTIPFVATLGLTELSVRLVSIISGTFVIYLIYKITNTMFRNRYTALTAAFLIAIEPWSVFFSRAAFEANLALAIYLSGVYLALESKLKGKTIIFSFFLLGASTYAYHSEKILVPLTIVLISLHFKENITKNIKVFFLSLIVLITISLPLLNLHLFQKETLSRLSSTSILANWNFQESGSLLLAKQIFSRYISYFSPVNIFVRGTPEPTQSIPGFGMFYLPEFIFWILGFYYIVKHFKKNRLLIGLILIAPIPAIFSWNWFYPLRVLPQFAFYSIVIAWGITKILAILKGIRFQKIIYLIIIGYFASLVTNFLISLFFSFPYTQKGSWQYGMKEIVSEIALVETNYEKVIFETRTAQPHIFTLFYSKYSPQMYQKQSKLIETPRKNFNFGKYEYRDVLFREDVFLTNTLLVGPESSLPLDTVRDSEYVDFVRDAVDAEGNILARLVGLK